MVFCLLAITGRILVSGETTSESRFEMRIAQGISAAGLALTCLWIVFGKTRWTLKILPPMVWLAFVCSIVMTAFGLRSWAVGASILTLSMVFLWLLLAAWIMRVKGIRLGNLSRVESTVQPVADNASRFPLRDIFYLTAIWVRWPVWLASPLLCAMLGVLFGAWLYKSNNYQGMAEYHGVVQLTGAIAIFFSLHAYRWRDWRFEV